jgi:hypothetical protein
MRDPLIACSLKTQLFEGFQQSCVDLIAKEAMWRAPQAWNLTGRVAVHDVQSRRIPICRAVEAHNLTYDLQTLKVSDRSRYPLGSGCSDKGRVESNCKRMLELL